MNRGFNKNKLAIITFSNNANYGGALQEYALFAYLNNDYDVKCFNYIDELIMSNLKPIRVGFILKLFYMIRDRFSGVKKVKTESRVKKTHHKNTANFSNLLYEGLNKTYLMLSDILHYKDRKTLINNYFHFWQDYIVQTEAYSIEQLMDKKYCEDKVEKFDVYISGSDQIWNPVYFGLSPVYFLLIAPLNRKKISFSSSFGNYAFNNEEISNEIIKYLSEYNHISVREQKSCLILNEKYGLNTQQTLDPTLMLTKTQWITNLRINIECLPKDYLLVYALGNKGRIISFAKKVGKKLKLKVIVIDNRYIFDIFSNIQYNSTAGPVEFIQLFANASFVVTNSFHGTAFSVNFNIPFFSIESKVPERVNSFLEKVNLSNRIITYKAIYSDDLSFDVNFDNANTILSKERQKSSDYLENAINNC